MKKNFLIVGGTSGVGLELAWHYVADGHTVAVTGRTPVDVPGASVHEFNVTDDRVRLAGDMDHLLAQVPVVHTLIYCEELRQTGRIESLDDDDICASLNIGLLAPAMLIQRLKRRSDWPLKTMLVTSNAQHTPLELEPVHSATQAGLGMFGASLVRDKALGKVLVTAVDEGLETLWVAQQIVELSSGSFKYKSAKLLSDPAQVEVIECLDNDLNAN